MSFDPIRTDNCLESPTPLCMRDLKKDMGSAGYNNVRAEMERIAESDEIDEFIEAVFFPGQCSKSAPGFLCKDGKYQASADDRQYFFYQVGFAFANGDPHEVLAKMQSAMNANKKLGPLERMELESAIAYGARPAIIGQSLSRAVIFAESKVAMGAHKPHVPDAPATPVTPATTPTQQAPGMVAQASKVSSVPTHHVEKNESLWSIAGKRLHDPDRWHEIWELNREQIGGNPQVLDKYITLTLPSDADQPPTDTRTHHVVKPGQSLWDIAEQRYGDGTLWNKVGAVNKDRLGVDGRGQRVVPKEGQVLRLPVGLQDRLIQWDGGAT